jgi:glycosyltransferase involved in cell wall biosynthesis
VATDAAGGVKPRVLFVVNQDWFLLSHRLPLARALRDRGAEVIVVGRDSGRVAAIHAEGFDFVALPISRKGLNPLAELRTILFLARLYRRLRPRLIHHSTVKPVVYGSIAARLAPDAAVVNTVSGLGYPFFSRDRVARALRPLLRVLYRVALARPRTRTIFQNPQDLRDFVRMGLLREDAAVLVRGSGVNCSVFHVTPESDGQPLVMLAARMLWNKGVKEFVQAVRLMRDAGVRARFALVGGPDAGNPCAIPVAQLEQWAREGDVEWWGHRRDMPRVLSQASVVVLPSTYGEGLPKVLLEAAASGRPIVATDVRGCREIVRDGVNGLLVPPGDVGALARAITRCLASPELRAQFGRAGRGFVEAEFAEGAVVTQTLGVYRQALGARWPEAWGSLTALGSP